MSTRLVQTTHTYPTPWAKSEDERLREIERVKDAIRQAGGVIRVERRTRNPVFDRPNERTTFELKVDWPPARPLEEAR